MSIFKNKYVSFYSSLDDEYCTIPIENTSYVPQGVCSIEDCVIISCYDYEHKLNSVLFICSKNEHKIINLHYKIHCGGICYHKDTDSLYVCGEGIGNKSFIHRYCGKKLLRLENNSTLDVEKIYCVDDSCQLYSSSAKHSSPAYITCYDNELYVGNFINYKDMYNRENVIKKYRILSNGNLSKTFVIFDNPYSNTQGLCLYKYENKIYYIFSRSFGRARNSILNIAKLENNQFLNLNSIVLPCMSEQINTFQNKLMIIFESYASCYSYNAINTSKYVYLLTFNKLLECNDSFKCFCKGDKCFVDNRGIQISGGK